MIPAFLSIDVEPDGFQLPFHDPPQWSGYGATYELMSSLREALTKRTGVAPQFGWYYRMDPQITEVYGRADYAATAFPERIEFLRQGGDYFGVHPHPIRWFEQRRLWVHDFADADYGVYCMRTSLEAFARWAGTPARHSRAGAAFLTNRIVATIEAYGVDVDLSPEPVAGSDAALKTIASGIDASPIIGAHVDCRTPLAMPYRPAPEDFRTNAVGSGHKLVMVPLTTYQFGYERPSWRGCARRLASLVKPRRHVASLSLDWPSAQYYWDLLEGQLNAMPRPFLSLAVRTDAPDSVCIGRVRRILEGLQKHALAERLRFVDPLAVVADLL